MLVQEEYSATLTLKEALSLALKVLKQVMEEKVDDSNVEVATVTAADGYQICGKEQLTAILADIAA